MNKSALALFRAGRNLGAGFRPRALARQRGGRQILVRNALGHELLGVTRIEVLHVFGMLDDIDRSFLGDDARGEVLLRGERPALYDRVESCLDRRESSLRAAAGASLQ